MREAENLVDRPEILDLHLKKDFVVNKMVWLAKKIEREFQFVILRFIINEEDVLSIGRQMNETLIKSEETWVDQTLFVTTSSDLEKGLMEAGLKNIVTVTEVQDDMVARMTEKVPQSSVLLLYCISISSGQTDDLGSGHSSL